MAHRPLALFASASAAVLAAMLPSAPLAQAEPPAPPVAPAPGTRARLGPYIGLQGIYTDNAAVSAEARRSDFITRAVAGLDAEMDNGRLAASGRAEYAYDWYSRRDDLNGGTAYANGSASYNLLRNRLWIDAEGVLSHAYASSFPISAIDRAGTPGRTRLTVLRVGPRMEARLGRFADVVAAARSQWVSYSAEDDRAFQQLPPDTNILQALGRIDTADRFSGYQLLTSGSYVRDDDGYRAANAVQSAYLRITPKTRLIGRAGYEHVRKRNVVDIEAPVLSAGVEVRPNAASRISLEGGRRYDRAAWNASAEVLVGDSVLVTAEYYETLSPSQVQAANSFARFVDQTKGLPAPFAPQNFMLRENIYDETSYNRAAEVHVIYGTPRHALDLSSRWNRREFIESRAEDVTFYGAALYTRRIRPDVEVGFDANYSRTLDSPIYGEFEAYGVSGRALYRLNSTTDFSASYHHSRGSQRDADGATTRENLFRIAIEKRF